jgi:hypothetical protein
MSTAVLSGQDTVTINGRTFVDLADQNAVELDFPNDIANCKTGKNGNSIYGLNETGNQADVKLRILRGSADDIFLMGILAKQKANFAGFVLMTGTFIKKLGDGQGNITSDTYIMGGGIFQKLIPGKMNTEGDVEQSLALYTLKFTNAPRTLT